MVRFSFEHNPNNDGGAVNEKKSAKIKAIKIAIKKGRYDWKKAIEDTASKIASYPQALLWR